MAYTFENAKLLDYSIKKDYIGEGLGLLKLTKNLEIEGFFDVRKLNLDAKGVKENLNLFKNKLENLIGQYDAIIINGYELGQGRILNISFPEENPILIGEYRYKIEIIENSNFSNLPQDAKYGAILSTISDKIEDFSENFDFKYTLDGYEYDYELDIKYHPNNDDLISKSKTLAISLFNENLNLFLLQNDISLYNSLKSKDHTFNETYDLIKKRCKFSKNLKINKNLDATKTYSINKNYSLAFSENGGITVKEDGEMLFLADFSTIQNLESLINNEIQNAYSNCQSVLNGYAGKYNLGNYENLKANPIQLGKEKDIFNKKIKYTIVYVNSISFLSTNRYLNYNTTIETNPLNIKNKIETGEILLVRLLQDSENISSSFSGMSFFQERRNLNEQDGFKIISYDFNIEVYGEKYGNKLSYNINSTTDSSITKNGIANKQVIDNSETPYLKEVLEYPIPANPTEKVILSNLLGEALKNKKVEMNFVLKRDKNPTDYFNYFKNLAWTNLGNINESTFVTEAQFSYDHLNNVNLSLSIQNG